MNDEKSNYIIEKNLTDAWGSALSLLLEKGKKEIQPLIVTVKDFDQNIPKENLHIRDEIDKLHRNKKKFNSHTVANTIFPKSLWNPAKERSLLYERFRRIFPKILEHDRVGKRYGRYFDRMIDYGNSSHKVNQLEYILSTIKKGNKRRSAYQVSIIDPLIDHTDQRMRGFPCLQQVAFSPLKGGGLSITGFYPYQYIFDRAYGNYLGLCWLGHFMAHELGLELKEMTCIAGIATLGGINKTNIKLQYISDLINNNNENIE